MSLCTIVRSLLCFSLALGSLCAGRCQTREQPCVGGSNYDGFLVRDVQVTTPFSFISAARAQANRALPIIRLHRGGRFHLADLNEDTSAITRFVRSDVLDGFGQLRFVATIPRLENCTWDTLSVKYTVYVVAVPRFSGDSSTVRDDVIEHPATAGSSFSVPGRLLLRPLVGYNQTRDIFGGLSFRTDAVLGPFSKISGTTVLSRNSAFGNAEFVGDHSSSSRILSEATWRMAYQSLSVPAGSARLTEANVSGSFFGTGRTSSRSQFIFHYGTSISGGHQQSTAPGSINSSLGKLNAAIEVEGGNSSTALSGSYGIEVGGLFENRSVDFVKHVVDFRASSLLTPLPHFLKTGKAPDDRVSFIGTTHKPLAIQFRAAGGVVQTLETLPAPERFFGGNQESRPFIDGMPWQMQSGPYIRSIPENELGASTTQNGFGGTRFYSLNLTVAKAIYGSSLLPRELGTQEFVSKVDFAINTAKGEVADNYFAKDPGVARISSQLGALAEFLAKLNSLATQASGNPEASAALHNLQSRLRVTALTVKSIQSGRAFEMPVLLNTQFPRLQSALTELSVALKTTASSDSASIQQQAEVFEEITKAVRESWNGLDQKAVRKRSNDLAQQDFATVDDVLQTCLYKLNVYSISPVGIFDITRIWPTNVGVRYAIGGGLRLSIVNANFTVGYAANPIRTSRERPGAFFFALDVSDLFR